MCKLQHRNKKRPGLEAFACNPRIKEAKVGKSQVWSQPWLYYKTISQNNKKVRNLKKKQGDTDPPKVHNSLIAKYRDIKMIGILDRELQGLC